MGHTQSFFIIFSAGEQPAIEPTHPPGGSPDTRLFFRTGSGGQEPVCYEVSEPTSFTVPDRSTLPNSFSGGNFHYLHRTFVPPPIDLPLFPLLVRIFTFPQILD